MAWTGAGALGCGTLLGRYLHVKSGDMISPIDEREHGIPIYGGNGIRGYTFRANSYGPIILLGRVGAKCGCIHLVKGELWASEHALRVFPHDNLNLNFLAYLFEHANLNQYAIRTAQPLINSTIVYSYRATLPPLPEQSAIVRYLDYMDRRIRRYIHAKQKLIKLLEEQKQAIIHRAVTRGLDPNVKLKSSGVEWLGDVPEHWEIKRIKHLALLKSGESITSLEINEKGDYPVFGGNGLRGFTSNYTHNGDFVLIGRQGALCGNVNYASGYFWASEHAVVANPIQVYNLLWFGELVRTMNLNQYSISAAQPGLSVERIQNIRMPVPPLEEQQMISDFIASSTADLDSAISFSKNEISLLREYRTRLIADVVTGKLDVREAAASLPDEVEEPEVPEDEESTEVDPESEPEENIGED